jgi:hypothetical protein
MNAITMIFTKIRNLIGYFKSENKKLETWPRTVEKNWKGCGVRRFFHKILREIFISEQKNYEQSIKRSIDQFIVSGRLAGGMPSLIKAKNLNRKIIIFLIFVEWKISTKSFNTLVNTHQCTSILKDLVEIFQLEFANFSSR